MTSIRTIPADKVSELRDLLIYQFYCLQTVNIDELRACDKEYFRN